MTLHLYRAEFQPATRYKVPLYGQPDLVITTKPRTRIRCFRCRCLHWAKHMVVQVYGDGCYYWCKDKDKCKKARKQRRLRRGSVKTVRSRSAPRSVASVAVRASSSSAKGASTRSTSRTRT